MPYNTTKSETELVSAIIVKTREKRLQTEYIMHMVRVGIIGSAGRGDDLRKMDRDVYIDMKIFSRNFVAKFAKEKGIRVDRIVLVSGGSAWSDHVAVQLFLESLASDTPYGGLQLYLPCGIVTDNGQLQFDTSPPGVRLNKLHCQFKASMGSGFDPMMDILCAKHLGAVLDCSSRSFQSRNIKVANVDALLAFTWGANKSTPTYGGTADTWNKCKRGLKYHVQLGALAAELRSSEKLQPGISEQRGQSDNDQAYSTKRRKFV